MNIKAFFSVILCLAGFAVASEAQRYEAEDAIVDENSIRKVEDQSASGGVYINMKEGILTFRVTAAAAGFYTVWSNYMVDDPNGKI